MWTDPIWTDSVVPALKGALQTRLSADPSYFEVKNDRLHWYFLLHFPSGPVTCKPVPHKGTGPSEFARMRILVSFTTFTENGGRRRTLQMLWHPSRCRGENWRSKSVLDLFASSSSFHDFNFDRSNASPPAKRFAKRIKATSFDSPSVDLNLHWLWLCGKSEALC